MTHQDQIQPAKEQTPPPPKKKLVIKSVKEARPADPEKPFVTVVLGETGVGKTYYNLKAEIPIYVKDNPAKYKKGRKAIIYDVNGDYAGIRTLKPTEDAIMKFVKQSTVEARRLVGKDEYGRPLSKEQNYENARKIVMNFINGMIIMDDIDKYAVHSSKQDLVSMLMGNRHIGCHVMTSHQAWRKMSVTELENIRYLRIHHTLDNIEALPADKQALLDFALCRIAGLIVEEQYEYATDLYESGKISKNKYEVHKAFFVYVDVRRKKIRGTSEEAFKRAAYKYMSEYPAVVDAEIQRMVYLGQLSGSVKTLKTLRSVRVQAMAVLYEKYKRYIK